MVKTSSLKLARTRKKRGYDWEDAIVKRFLEKGWVAMRLGSPSIHLPDVLAIDNHSMVILAIEAKSGTRNSIVIPGPQVERTYQFVESFKAYKERKVILAVKFLSKKRVASGKYTRRKRREFFFDVTDWVKKKGRIPNLTVNYEGKIYPGEKEMRMCLIGLPLGRFFRLPK